MADDEAVGALPANAGGFKGHPLVNSGKEIEVGDSTDGSMAGGETGVGLGGASTFSVAKDGKDEDECRASARRASSSGKKELEVET